MHEIRYTRLKELGATIRPDGTFELSLVLPMSPKGMQYRLCPSEECTPRLFQLGDEGELQQTLPDRARRHARSPMTTCPYCGHDGEDEAFIDQRDIDDLTKQVEWALTEDVGEHVEEWATDLNRRLPRRRDSLISMEVQVDRQRRSRPIAWREDLLRDLTCPACIRRYGVYAVALFCPDCGAPNLAVHFDRELDLIRKQIELATETGDSEQDEELAYRLLGNAHEDVVTALETYLKTAYRFLVRENLREEADILTSKRAIGNAFQNIDKGRRLYGRLDIDPVQSLAPEEVEILRLNIEKRHVVGHNLGLADEHYVEAVGDEGVGRTVTLLAEEVQHFAELCRRVIVVADAATGTTPPSPRADS